METLDKVALFWDVDRSKLDEDLNADFIIRRILARGNLDDVHWALERYGTERLAAVASQTRDLDARSRNFWLGHFIHA